MNQTTIQKGHPKGLYVLFATEMWERFNYYGMRAILVLFMTKALLFDKVFASSIWQLYWACILDAAGGWIYSR
jgi:POT family proton-dependent oligopeptide transporter